MNKLEFGEIIGRNDYEITQSFIRAYEKNKKLFDKDITDVKVIIVDTEEEFKEETGKHHVDWATGITIYGNKIILKSKELANGADDYYDNYAAHELNHAFWYQNYGTWKPKWLMEGFACHTAKDYFLDKEQLRQLIIKFKIKSDMVDYTSIRKKLKGHYPKYPLWSNFTRFIINKYGEERIREFMQEYSKKHIRKNYDNLFQKHFETNDIKLFNEFVENIRSRKLTDF